MPTITRRVALAAAGMLLAPLPGAAAQEKVPSAVVNADSGGKWVRTSEYLTVRDGTRLAIDVIHPAVNGVPIPGKLPIVLQATPYQRALVQNGEVVNAADNDHADQRGRKAKAQMAALSAAGFVIASLDLRGRGASFGIASAGDSGTDQDRADLYDTVEWLAQQPYSDGQIGMAGCSYVGRTIMWAAAMMPPHLAAIAPSGVPLDNYESVMRPGGVKQTGFFDGWDQMMQHLAGIGVPVDADKDQSLLREAVAQHVAAWAQSGSLIASQKARPYRDTQNNPPDAVAMEYNTITNFRMSQLPVLHIGGWRDLFPQDVVRWRQTLDTMGVRQRLVIGPWYHCEWYGDAGVAKDHVDWFSRWLKGAANGVESEPKIRYYVLNAPAGREWKSANAWPIPGTADQTLYFAAGAAAAARPSVNGGALGAAAPAAAGGADRYTIDYTVTTKDTLNTRWNIPPFGTAPKLDTSPIDRKALTYTTAAFTRGAEYTGSPVVKVWLKADAPDADVYAYLSVVNPDGTTQLVTDGVLRASNRKLRNPPFENGGLPWHSSRLADRAPLVPGEPALLEFALYPTAFWVKPGQQVRLTIAGFDKDMFDTPQLATPPTLEVLRDAAHPSALVLPRAGR